MTELEKQLAEALRGLLADNSELKGLADHLALAEAGRAALAAYAAAQSASEPAPMPAILNCSDCKKPLTVIEAWAYTSRCEQCEGKAFDALESDLNDGPAPSEPAQGEAVESAAKAVFQQLPGWCGQPWVDGGNSLKQDEARRYARAALASQPAARVALTKTEFARLWRSHMGSTRFPREAWEAKEITERAHGITAPAAQEKQG